MDVLDAVLAFLSSFEPKDWTTAGLSIAAIAISVVALRQRERHVPRPNMKVLSSEIIDNDAEHVPFWDFVVQNRGNADALNVAFVSPISGFRHERGTVPQGKKLEQRWSVTEDTDQKDAHGRTLSANGPVDPKDHWVWLEWCQAPRVEKVRRIKIQAT